MTEHYGAVSVRPVLVKPTAWQDHTTHNIIGPIQITGGAETVTPRLADALAHTGLETSAVEMFGGGLHTGIITAGLCAGTDDNVHWAALRHAQAFRVAGGKRLIILQDTGGDFSGGPSGGWHGGLSGLAKTAAREWPDISVQIIDIAGGREGTAAATANIAQAMATNQPEIGIGAAGIPHRPTLGEPLGVPGSALATPLAGVWLVTGGARGVTAGCIREVAARTGGQFALLGRSQLSPWPTGIAPTVSLPALRAALAKQAKGQQQKTNLREIDKAARDALAAEEIRDTLAGIQAAGGQASYHACDLSNAGSVAHTIETIRTAHGPITGLVHGAGALADRLIVDKTRADFDRVFGAKVTGLSVILENLDLQTLDHVAFFSSAAARFGNIGQADYAMANEILNRVARDLKEKKPDAQIKSFNWGPWDGGMVDETLARHFEARGITLISAQTGARIFADQILTGARDQVELLIGDAWDTPA